MKIADKLMALNEKVCDMRGIRWVFAACAAIICFPSYFGVIRFDIDASWLYMINAAGSNGLKFGTDIFFTFGPLGFLTMAQQTGANVLISVVFWTATVALHFFLLAQTPQHRKGKLLRYLLCLLILALQIPIPGDYRLNYLVLLALSIAWKKEGKMPWFCLACALTLVLCFIKFSGAVAGALSLLLFVALTWVDEKKPRRELLLALGATPVVFVVLYMLYNPSLSGLLAYIKAALEISSGFSSAMSIYEGHIARLGCAVLIGISYAALAVITLVYNKKAGLYLLLFAGVLFTAFKHGFVRADGHTYFFFSSLLIYMSIIVLFCDVSSVKPASKLQSWWRVGSLCLMATWILLAVMVFPQIKFVNPVQKIKENILWLQGKANSILEDSGAILPNAILEEIGDEPVTVYPIDLAYGAYNAIHLRPMPVLQAYSVYTPYLDEKNAAFFISEETAPPYIIFNVGTIDNRWPMIECPLTWKAIYDHYYVKYLSAEDRTTLLLERIPAKDAAITQVVESQMVRKDDTVLVPQGDDGEVILMQMNAELSLFGKLVKTFYQIPAVNMTVIYADGHEETRRVLPEVLVNPVIIDTLPMNEREAADFVNRRKAHSEERRVVSSIRFSGPGWRFFKKEFHVAFSKYMTAKQEQPFVMTALPQNRIDYKAFVQGQTPTGESIEICFDSTSPRAAEGQITCETTDAIELDGWCYNTSQNTDGTAVHFRVGEVVFEAKTCARGDVAEFFQKPAIAECGFQVVMPVADMTPGSYPISVILLDEREGTFTECETNLTVVVGNG